MYIWYKTLAILLSSYQKVLKLIDIWRSSDTDSLCSFFRHGVYKFLNGWTIDPGLFWIQLHALIPLANSLGSGRFDYCYSLIICIKSKKYAHAHYKWFCNSHANKLLNISMSYPYSIHCIFPLQSRARKSYSSQSRPTTFHHLTHLYSLTQNPHRIDIAHDKWMLSLLMCLAPVHCWHLGDFSVALELAANSVYLVSLDEMMQLHSWLRFWRAVHQ